jgi:hypothetical protein
LRRYSWGPGGAAADAAEAAEAAGRSPLRVLLRGVGCVEGTLLRRYGAKMAAALAAAAPAALGGGIWDVPWL